MCNVLVLRCLADILRPPFPQFATWVVVRRCQKTCRCKLQSGKCVKCKNRARIVWSASARARLWLYLLFTTHDYCKPHCNEGKGGVWYLAIWLECFPLPPSSPLTWYFYWATGGWLRAQIRIKIRTETSPRPQPIADITNIISPKLTNIRYASTIIFLSVGWPLQLLFDPPPPWGDTTKERCQAMVITSAAQS